MADTKQPLTLQAFDVDDSKVVGEAFKVMLNPTGYARSVVPKYSKQGNRLNAANPEDLVIEDLVLDGTGIVPAGTGAPLSVEQQLTRLRAVLFFNSGDDRVRSPLVQVVWGSLYFLGRLKRIEVKYTLFKPNGLPLRPGQAQLLRVR
jgi:hypothetical protein